MPTPAPELAESFDCPVDRFQKLGRIAAGGWVPLPSWGSYLVLLGSRAVKSSGAGDGPTVRALVLPTRAYAAVFCAVGAVLRRVSAAVPADTAGHFAALSRLPVGTTVTYRTSKALTRFPGRLMGSESLGGVDYLVIQPSQKALIRVPARYALDVMPSERAIAELPEQATSKVVRGCGALMSALLPPNLLWNWLASSRLECVIVGSESTLREEIARTTVGFLSVGGLVEGALQELLRVRRFITDDGPYRSEVFAVTGERHDVARAATPEIVVFDGAMSFLRWGALWPAAERIIVLDRTERRLSDATTEVDRIFLQRVSTVDDCPPDAPAGVHSLAFQSRAS